MKWHHALIVAALLSVPVALVAQAPAAQPAVPAKPWPPARLADGQPDVQGSWRSINGGTHSIDPAKSSNTDFEERLSGKVTPTASRVVDPADGHLPYQPWAAALQKGLEAAYENPTKPEHIDTQTRCFVPGVPRLYYFPTFKILQPPGSVIMVWDEYHAFRVIPLDGRPHVGAGVKLWVGDGRGRWEGNTLIVDTTNLKAKSRLDVIGDFFTDKARVTERFVFVDANTLNYEATITDPTVFTRPWTMRVTHRRMPDQEFWEWACHEGERDAAVTAGTEPGAPAERK
jgi:hypothetical protein